MPGKVPQASPAPPAAAPGPRLAHRDDLHPAQGQPRQDPDRPRVVGVTRSAKGELAVTPGAEDVAGGVGPPVASAAGLDGVQGRPRRGPAPAHRRCHRRRPAPGGRPGCPGRPDPGEGAPRRRGRGPQPRQRRVGRPGAAGGDAAHVGAVVGGFVSGSYSFTRYKSRADDTAVADVAVLSEVARQPEAVAALETARTVGALVDRARDWVNTPPNDLDPTRFADDVVALVEGKEHRKAGLGGRGPRRRGAHRARLRRHPRRRAGLGHAAPPGHAHLGARRRRRGHALDRPGRQGHHLRLGRPEHQVGSRRWP